MKHLTILLVLTILQLTIYAQSFEKTFQDAPYMSGHLIEPLENGDILVGAQLRYSAALYRLDSQGNVIWKALEVFESGDPVELLDILVTTDNYIYVIAGSGTCDIGGFWTKFAKLDATTGEVICNNGVYWENDLIGTQTPRGRLFEINPSSIVFLTQYNATMLNGSCQNIGSENFAALTIDAIKIDATIVVIEDDLGAGTAGIINTFSFPDLLLIDSQNIDAPKKLSSAPDGNLFVLQENGITKFDNTFTILEEIEFVSSVHYKDIIASDESVFIVGTEANNIIISEYDHNLSIIGNFIVSENHVFPTDLDISNDQLLICGFVQDNFTGLPIMLESNLIQQPWYLKSTNLWIKSVSTDNLTNDSRPDVGLVGLSYDGMLVAEQVYCGNPFYALRDVTFQNVIINVINNGNVTVDNFNLSSAFPGCSLCGGDIHFKYPLADLNLIPGEEREINIGDLFVNYINTLPDSYELCLWTSSPNDSFDPVWQNNISCQSTENIILPISDILANTNFSIFPNPASDEIYVDYNLEAAVEVGFRLYNIYGKEVFYKSPSLQPSGQNQTILPVAKIGLTTGIYFLTTQIGDNRISRKVEVLNGFK